MHYCSVDSVILFAVLVIYLFIIIYRYDPIHLIYYYYRYDPIHLLPAFNILVVVTGRILSIFLIAMKYMF